MKQAVLRSLNKNSIFLLSLFLVGCKAAPKKTLGAGFVFVAAEGSPYGLGTLQQRENAYEKAKQNARDKFLSQYNDSQLIHFKSQQAFDNGIVENIFWNDENKASLIMKISVSDLQGQLGGHKLAE